MNRLLLLGTGGIAAPMSRISRRFPNARSSPAWTSCPARPRPSRRGTRLRAFESLEEAIAWDGFDAAVNATPDGAHKATTLAMIAAGKHVFCEKPLAPNYADALAMTEAAEAAGVVNMVNLTYRNSPALQQARGWSRPARSANCAMSRPPTGRAGWSARPGATGARSSAVAVAAVDRAWLDRRSGRRRHPHPRFCQLRRGR